MNNFKKYLPSKKFVVIVLIIIGCVALFFTIKGIVSFLKNKKQTRKDNNVPIEITVGDLIQKDGNFNGIADWEEYLWGLDPYKNGEENKAYILAKKKALIESGDIIAIDDSQTISDNELLSRQFLATIVSLQQTGNLDAESMGSVAETIGKNVVATPIPDIYTSDMLIIQNDSTVLTSNYHDALSSLINNYSDADIGSELTFIIQGLNNKDPSALYATTTVADAYQSFGQDLIKIPVPKSLSKIHLNLANNYEKVGQSIRDLAKMLSDPLIAMKSIINYKNYSDALASDLEKLSGILQ